MTDEQRIIAALSDALKDACAALAVGMVIAHKTPGSFDALSTMQTAFAHARDVLANLKGQTPQTITD